MAVSSAVLRKDISDILEDADLTTLSSKKVRLQLSEKYGCDLQSRKEEIDKIILDMISQGPSNAGSPPKKAAKPAPKKAAKPVPSKKTANGSSVKSIVDDDVSSDDDASDEEMKPDKTSDSDDNVVDDELLARKLQQEESASLRNKSRKVSRQRPKTGKKKPEKSEDGTKPKRINRYNEPCVLSPELAAIMGEPALPRHMVVKKIWAIVKERNLADPKNKQFMICDDQLMTVFGRKKVRTFGMMKYLSEHMSSPNSASKRH